MGKRQRRDRRWRQGWNRQPLPPAQEPDAREIRACRRKNAYSRGKATTVAIVMHEMYGDSFDVYECVYCGRWHVGHTPGSGGGK